MNRTLIYARVSTEDQMEKYGLPSQLRACRELAASRDLVVLDEITDDGVSGAVLERPGLSRVRQRVLQGEADVVLMLDPDRLSRELGHLVFLKTEIERNARFEFVSGKFEDSPSGRLFFHMKGSFAQYEREVIRERTMRGKKERARAGLIVGGRTAYGYRYEAGRLVEDEERAVIVRRIYQSYDAGISLRGITRELRSTGAPTWGGRHWGHSSVRRILTNETYAGIAHYGTHKRTGSVLRMADRANRIALVVPALITREQWDRVQARFAQNREGMGGRPGSTYLLRGILFCGSCGRRMTGEGGRCNAYRCHGRDTLRISAPRCLASVSAPKLDAAVWQTMLDTFTEARVLRNLLSPRTERMKKSAQPDRLQALERQIAKLKAREERTLSLLCDPDLDKVAVKRQYTEAQRGRIALEREVSALRPAAPLPDGQWLEAMVSLIREEIPGFTAPSQRQKFVRGLVQRAEWLGVSGEVALHCFLGTELGNTSARCEQFSGLSFVVLTRVA